ncbi:unnamed protein product [Polarella glacialis]|uniref:Uncharacterized protein n=1 Tax=Polarella glacialis TaxID=89957 RepID=A0A813HJQ0_POLGL|nr:unnamed protein product [Polarella glacialis]
MTEEKALVPKMRSDLVKEPRLSGRAGEPEKAPERPELVKELTSYLRSQSPTRRASAKEALRNAVKNNWRIAGISTLTSAEVEKAISLSSEGRCRPDVLPVPDSSYSQAGRAQGTLALTNSSATSTDWRNHTSYGSRDAGSGDWKRAYSGGASSIEGSWSRVVDALRCEAHSHSQRYYVHGFQEGLQSPFPSGESHQSWHQAYNSTGGGRTAMPALPAPEQAAAASGAGKPGSVWQWPSPPATSSSWWSNSWASAGSGSWSSSGGWGSSPDNEDPARNWTAKAKPEAESQSLAGGWGSSPDSEDPARNWTANAKSAAESPSLAGGWGSSPDNEDPARNWTAKAKPEAESQSLAGGWGSSPDSEDPARNWTANAKSAAESPSLAGRWGSSPDSEDPARNWTAKAKSSNAGASWGQSGSGEYDWASGARSWLPETAEKPSEVASTASERPG